MPNWMLVAGLLAGWFAASVVVSLAIGRMIRRRDAGHPEFDDRV